MSEMKPISVKFGRCMYTAVKITWREQTSKIIAYDNLGKRIEIEAWGTDPQSIRQALLDYAIKNASSDSQK